nr:F-box and FNIP repeat domain containing protein [Mimivirus sp.]
MSIIDILNIDVIICMLDHLKDHDKMSFMMTCKEYYDLRSNINYTNLYEYDFIKKLPIINRFKRLVYRDKIFDNNISINKTIQKYYVKYLSYHIPINVTHLIF